MKELGVFVFLDTGLDLIQSLLDELAVLDVQDSVSVALNLWVVSDHHASSCTLLAFSLWANSVDVEDEVHDCHYNSM